MAEKRVEFPSDGKIAIEGLLHSGTVGSAVVITHPHPLFGGDMYNNVVEAIQKACQEKGYSTLRFNFRGVGNSRGTYDDGIGEQQDVMAACRFLEESGIETIHLAGYSFGAWINAKVADKLSAYPMVMVSPPAAILQFPPDLKIPLLKLVVTGSNDEFAAPDLIKGLAFQWNPSARFEVINGADHFYWGHTEALVNIVKACI